MEIRIVCHEQVEKAGKVVFLDSDVMRTGALLLLSRDSLRWASASICFQKNLFTGPLSWSDSIARGIFRTFVHTDGAWVNLRMGGEGVEMSNMDGYGRE